MKPLLRFFCLFSLILAFGLGFGPQEVAARTIHSACDTAKSTAETLECLNRHKTQVQDQLQEIYDELIPVLEVSSQKVLTAAQNSWLAYRDAECSWEAKSAEAPSLERVYEIACIARLTKERAEALFSILVRQEEGLPPPEFSATPRWLNVFAHDYPAVFWRHGSWISADTDCDGQKEQVLAGIKVNPVPDGTENKRTVRREIASYIAVAENPVTGRPGAEIVMLPLVEAGSEQSAPHVCQAEVKLRMTTLPPAALRVAKEKTAATESAICERALEVTSRGCPAVYIYRDGETYRAIQQNITEAGDKKPMIVPPAKPKTVPSPR